MTIANSEKKKEDPVKNVDGLDLGTDTGKTRNEKVENGGDLGRNLVIEKGRENAERETKDLDLEIGKTRTEIAEDIDLKIGTENGIEILTTVEKIEKKFQTTVQLRKANDRLPEEKGLKNGKGRGRRSAKRSEMSIGKVSAEKTKYDPGPNQKSDQPTKDHTTTAKIATVQTRKNGLDPGLKDAEKTSSQSDLKFGQTEDDPDPKTVKITTTEIETGTQKLKMLKIHEFLRIENGGILREIEGKRTKIDITGRIVIMKMVGIRNLLETIEKLQREKIPDPSHRLLTKK